MFLGNEVMGRELFTFDLTVIKRMVLGNEVKGSELFSSGMDF